MESNHDNGIDVDWNGQRGRGGQRGRFHHRGQPSRGGQRGFPIPFRGATFMRHEARSWNSQSAFDANQSAVAQGTQSRRGNWMPAGVDFHHPVTRGGRRLFPHHESGFYSQRRQEGPAQMPHYQSQQRAPFVRTSRTADWSFYSQKGSGMGQGGSRKVGRSVKHLVRPHNGAEGHNEEASVSGFTSKDNNDKDTEEDTGFRMSLFEMKRRNPSRPKVNANEDDTTQRGMMG